MQAWHGLRPRHWALTVPVLLLLLLHLLWASWAAGLLWWARLGRGFLLLVVVAPSLTCQCGVMQQDRIEERAGADLSWWRDRVCTRMQGVRARACGVARESAAGGSEM